MSAVASRKRQNAEPHLGPSKKIKILQDDDESQSDSDSDEEETLNINPEFAKRFEHNKKRAELHRLEEKYGKSNGAGRPRPRDDEDDTDTDSESEDDDGELATVALDSEILATLQAIRTKDPRVYDDKAKFYNDIGEEKRSPEIVKKDKPMFLKDYHRKTLLEGQGEDEKVPKTYVQEQEALKRDLVDAIHAETDKDSDSDDGAEDGFLLAKKIIPAEMEKPTIPDLAIAEREPETFLSNFLASRAWVPTESSRFANLESDDEEEDKKAEEWEDAYNLRFENPEVSNQKLTSHAREAAAKYSARREEVSGRKKQREKEREKKEEQRKERQAERLRLRKLRVEEMESRVQKIREAAGLKGKSVRLEEWSSVLEDDWNDDKFDEEMRKHFGDAYYDEDDDVDTKSSSKKKKKEPKKPTWDDDLDIKDLVPDFESDSEPASAIALSDDDEDNGEDDPALTGSTTRRNHKKEKADAKAAARRDRRLIEQLVDQSLPLETAASSSKNFTPFRYRETSPVTFGLTPLDILVANDSQLNEFAGLKKLAAFRDPERKKMDKKKLGKKARLRQWRKDTFGTEEGPKLEGVFSPGGLKSADAMDVDQAENEEGVVKDGERKQKKKKKRGKKVVAGGVGSVVIKSSTKPSSSPTAQLIANYLMEQPSVTPPLRVIGLEVNNLVNKYLPPENAVTVKGTWDIYNKSSEYNTWLFVYPRSPKLISSYLELPMVPYTIIWLGPRKDWDDFRTPFVASEFKLEEIEDAGLVHYETMVLMTKESSLSSADGFVPLSKSQIDEI
ncbi:Protein KRI1 [Venturia nashicola]|nr:Protein KRI1 [Venturia nashicola]